MPHSESPPAEVKVEAATSPTAPSDDVDDVVMADAETEAPGPAVSTGSKVKDELQDIPSDMDSDDEFPTSSKPAPKDESPEFSQPSSFPEKLDSGAATSELMPIFYQRFFPWRFHFLWLNHSPKLGNDYRHREFSLWLPNQAVLRFKSYDSHDLLKREALNVLPTRIEIGPVYSTNPKEKKRFTGSKAQAFRPIAKELCFDIDLTDYDDIRTCCEKTTICIKCWQFITMAIKVLDRALREDFGFKHILWVYSGRRGAHAWVCDKKARLLTDQQRKAITGYFDIVKGSGPKRVNVRKQLQHPHLSRSLDILRSHFEQDILATQDPWLDPAKADHLLALLPDHAPLRDGLRKKWAADPTRSSASKWDDIDAVATTVASKSLDTRALLDAKKEIILEYTYPRLDVNVSTKLNHLLKSPFVIHPGTGRVCVPIDTRHLERFDPMGVPTIQDLVRELDEWVKPEGDDEAGRRMQDWEKTSLRPYIGMFETFVKALMNDEDETKVKREREEGEGIEY